MRSGHAARSPRLVVCALVAAAICFLVPFRLSRDSQNLVAVEQPAHLTCSGAPVRKATSWLPGNAGALSTLRADEDTVQSYIKKCILPASTVNEEARTKVGIVIPAGGTALLSSTLAVTTILRKTLMSTLPVEVVYNGQEEYDGSLVNQLHALQNVTCIDARQVAYPRHHLPLNLKGLTFEFKAFVLAYATSFDQVLLLDADNFPLRKPDDLFTASSSGGGQGSPFQQHGSLFWPDFGQKQGDNSTLLAPHLDMKPEAYTAFNLSIPWADPADPPYVFTESGQMLFDRVRHADVLEWLWFLSSHRKPIFDWMWGDKDTYRLAFALAGKVDNFQLLPVGPRLALDAGGTPPEPPFRHAGMLQHDLDGNLQFLHRTWTGKFDPASEEHWREIDFITMSLTPPQVLAYAEDNQYGFFPHQCSTDFEKYCCPNGTRTSGGSQCDFKQCKSPGDPLPLLTIAVSNLDPGVKAVLTSMDLLFTSLQANHSIVSS